MKLYAREGCDRLHDGPPTVCVAGCGSDDDPFIRRRMTEARGRMAVRRGPILPPEDPGPYLRCPITRIF